MTQNLHLQGSKGTRRKKKPKRIQSTVSAIHDIVIANLRQGHICIKFHLKIWKTALEKLKTQSGFPVMTQIPNSTLLSGKAHSFQSKGNESNIKSMLVKFFDCWGIAHQKFVIPGQTAALLVGVFIMYERARPPKESETLMEPGMV